MYTADNCIQNHIMCGRMPISRAAEAAGVSGALYLRPDLL